MTSPALIEAAAKAMYIRRKGRTDSPWEKINTQHREPYRKDVRAVLSAIEAAGMAVVPVEVKRIVKTSVQYLESGNVDIICPDGSIKPLIDLGKL